MAAGPITAELAGAPGGPAGPITVELSGAADKPSKGTYVYPTKPTEAVTQEGPTSLLLALLIVVGGVIVILTGLVLADKLSSAWLDAITSDSEVGLVLTTIYIITIELGRDRKDREKERRDRELKEKESAKAALQDPATNMRRA
ncbi:MAG: hypothetical protein ACLQD9_05785 [Thermoplasmata archaeon]